jgi:hypothetical protein
MSSAGSTVRPQYSSQLDCAFDSSYEIGPSFWDKRLLTLTKLDRIPGLTSVVPNIGLNEAFMVFGTCALAFNIISRWVYIFLNFGHASNVGGRQLYECTMGDAIERHVHHPPVVVLAALCRGCRDPSPMASPTELQRRGHHQLCHVCSIPQCMGSAICTSSRENDPSPCHEHAIPMVALDLDLERRRCCRR